MPSVAPEIAELLCEAPPQFKGYVTRCRTHAETTLDLLANALALAKTLEKRHLGDLYEALALLLLHVQGNADAALYAYWLASNDLAADSDALRDCVDADEFESRKGVFLAALNPKF